MSSQPFSRYSSIIPDYSAFCEALTSPLPVTFWPNPERVSLKDLRILLTKAGFSPRPIPWHPAGMRLPSDRRAGKRREFFNGLYQIQEEAAMLPVLLLDPQPGELILDMCAAPGNKTAQIAFAMQNRGTVIANDLNRKRLPALRQTCERLGLRNVSLTNHNGGNIAAHAAEFDRILVDAPCSCEGTTRKNPGQPTESEIHFTEKQRRAQAALLRKAVQLCKVGGRIVYSTCTYAPEENEAVINKVIREYGRDCLTLLEPAIPDSLTASPGLTQWEGESYDPKMTHCRRLYPHQNDTGGFFVAVLEKTGPPSKSNESKNADSPEPRPDFTPATASPELHAVLDHFGIDPKTIDQLKTVQGRGNQLFLTADDHFPPAYFETADTGLRSLRLDGAEPKLTHPGTLFLGKYATCNIVPLSEERAMLFMRRKAMDLTTEELCKCNGTGYVIVKHGGFTCGLGQLRRAPEGHHFLTSNYPRRWAARLFS
ncbi:MAG: RNA methyltransferase [Lentisphaeria bacterium]